MKRGYYSLFVLFFLSYNIFAGGVPDKERLNGTYYKYINGKVLQLTETRYFNRDGLNEKKYSSIHFQRYEYLQNGLIFIYTRYNDVEGEWLYLCYNEYFNEKIESNIKLDEVIGLAFLNIDAVIENIQYNEQIITINVKHSLNDAIEEDRLVATFDSVTKRLKTFERIYRVPSLLVSPSYSNYNKYEYHYNDDGRLINVYRYVGNVPYIISSKFYDGLLIETPNLSYPYYGPSFERWDYTPLLPSISIFDDTVLKYFISLRTIPPNVNTRTDKETRDANLYYVTFEFDEHRNETRQVSIFGDNNWWFKEAWRVVTETQYLRYDIKNNWIHAITLKDNKIIEETFREIIYE